jgi:hypothetical protein
MTRDRELVLGERAFAPFFFIASHLSSSLIIP